MPRGIGLNPGLRSDNRVKRYGRHARAKAERSETHTATASMRGLSDRYVEADATTASFTLTLPPIKRQGQSITIKKTNAANTVTIGGAVAAATIDGSATVALSTQYASVTLMSEGTGWKLTREYTP